MCIIAICNDRKLTEEELKSCWDNNDDGAGMAWFDGKHHVIDKGYMNFDELRLRYETIDIFPHVIHFRIATAGGKIPELTHPFICSRMSPTAIEWKGKDPVLFHNGIVSNWYGMADILGIKVPDHNWSDTRILASILTESELDFLEQEGGKYAVLVGKEIMTYGKFTEVNGVQFSNSTYDGSWNVWAGFEWDDFSGWKGGQRHYNRSAYNTNKRALTVVPTTYSLCENCNEPSIAVCNYCPERSKPNSKPFREAKEFQEKDYSYASLCVGCHSSGIICRSCSERDKPGSMAYQNKITNEGYREVVVYNDEFLLSEKDTPFSKCSGRCDECFEYDAATNTCTEVHKAMATQETSLTTLEESLQTVVDEECVDRGESCYMCAHFDADHCRCTVW